MESITNFLDQHQGLLQVTATATAFAGIVVISRSIRLVSKFQTIDTIPAEFIRKRVQLRGQCCQVKDNGAMIVEHLPIINLPQKWSRRLPNNEGACGKLNIYLAGVGLNESGRQYLTNTLGGTPNIWFQPLAKDDAGEQLEALVKMRTGVFSSRLLNEEVLKLGLGKVQPLLAPPSRFSQKLTERLIKAEMYAERKRKGLWKPLSLRRRIAERLSRYNLVNRMWNYPVAQSIENVFRRMEYLLKGLFKRK